MHSSPEVLQALPSRAVHENKAHENRAYYSYPSILVWLERVWAVKCVNYSFSSTTSSFFAFFSKIGIVIICVAFLIPRFLWIFALFIVYSKHPSIRFLSLISTSGWEESWSLSLLLLGKWGVTPWTNHQFIARLIQGGSCSHPHHEPTWIHSFP